MGRESTKQFGMNPNIRCKKVYPVTGSRKSISELKSVGLKLSREQARHLAQVLLIAADAWEEIDVTAYSTSRQSDGTHEITVTSLCEGSCV
jgi:hypothetical protein